MPELPEVENVRLGLSQHITDQPLKKTHLFRKDLRFALPVQMLWGLKKHRLLNLSRRGKFLIFNFDHISFYSHLGMTGHWRVEPQRPKQKLQNLKHDHVVLEWEDRLWVYNDPRRFGYIGLNDGSLEKKFGPDPILDTLRAKNFFQRTRHIKQPIKSWLMDQKNILGVGNIYASEVLFACGIHPLRPTAQVTLKEWSEIIKHTRRILKLSIRLGGSTLKDYRKVDGSAGGFQNTWTVYGRKKEACKICQSPIELLKMSGRSTYVCNTCQG